MRLQQRFANAIAADLARGDRFTPWPQRSREPQWPADVLVDAPRRRQHQFGFHGYFCAICRTSMRDYVNDRVGCALISGLPRLAPLGEAEGDLCLRGYSDGICLGKLEFRPSDRWGGCTCFISAPCGHCMSIVPECPECGHREPEPD